MRLGGGTPAVIFRPPRMERGGRGYGRLMTIAQQRGTTVASAPLTIASVPSGHVYVRHLSLDAPGAVRRLADPSPTRASNAATNQWWPPAMLDPEWARESAFDVFHLHFGFDASTPDQLRALTGVLRDRGKPFVFTVHDLRNPHHEDRDLHDAQLDELIPAADAVVTLTDGAAAEIERRWGRAAHVVPHPHVVELQSMAVALRVRERWLNRPFRVGVHVKSLRASMDPMRILPTLTAAVADLDDAVLQVNGHHDVLDPSGSAYDRHLARYLRREEAAGRLELVVHDYFTDAELWSYLTSLDVSVLPYRFGTHSGWLEACRDLQTTVVAPTCGYYADQGPVLSYVHDGDEFDADSLRDAVTGAHRDRPRFGASIDDRRQQRRDVAAAHDELYRSLT